MDWYQLIDGVCDAVNPALLIYALAEGYRQARTVGQRSIAMPAALLAAGLFFTYLWLYLDGYFLLFPRIGLDYSTHTCFALTVCAVIGSLRQQWLGITSVFVFYLSAMVYQNYHSIADIAVSASLLATTVTLFLLPCLSLKKACLRGLLKRSALKITDSKPE